VTCEFRCTCGDDLKSKWNFKLKNVLFGYAIANFIFANVREL